MKMRFRARWQECSLGQQQSSGKGFISLTCHIRCTIYSIRLKLDWDNKINLQLNPAFLQG